MDNLKIGVILSGSVRMVDFWVLFDRGNVPAEGRRPSLLYEAL